MNLFLFTPIVSYTSLSVILYVSFSFFSDLSLFICEIISSMILITILYMNWSLKAALRFCVI